MREYSYGPPPPERNTVYPQFVEYHQRIVIEGRFASELFASLPRNGTDFAKNCKFALIVQNIAQQVRYGDGAQSCLWATSTSYRCRINQDLSRLSGRGNPRLVWLKQSKLALISPPPPKITKIPIIEYR